MWVERHEQPEPSVFSPSDEPQQDGHLYYGRVRIATEVLEKLRFLESSERRTRVKELHAAGTTTAATLKHIGGMTPLEPHIVARVRAVGSEGGCALA